MLDISIDLDSLLCNSEGDSGGAEPYFWSLFFHVDTGSIRQGPDLLRSTTPLSDFTTRSMYPSGIRAGETVPIPPQIGHFDVALEDGQGDLPIFGFIGLLFDRKNTDANAIRAAHRAFANAGHLALNDVAPVAVIYGPGPQLDNAIDDAVDLVKTRMIDALRDALDWWDYADGQDRFIGHALRYFTGNQLRAVSDSATQPLRFTETIRLERSFQNPSFPALPPTVLLDDYTLNGILGVRDTAQPRPPFGIQQEAIGNANIAIATAQKKTRTLRERSKGLTGAALDAVIAEIKDQDAVLGDLRGKRAAAAGALTSLEGSVVD